MTVGTRVALLCVVFLCGLEYEAHSQRLRCDGASCLWLHREPRDFAGAQKGCAESNAQFLALTLRDAEVSLPGLLAGSSGSYWLKLRSNRTGSAEDEAAARQRCFAASVSGPHNVTVSEQQCRNKQDGFLCRSTSKGSCSRRLTSADMEVKFLTTHMGWELLESERFPEGTIAVAGKFLSKGEHLDAKYLCFDGGWLRAPWVCEVLSGGCARGCNKATKTCMCPSGETLHPNNITCTTASEPQGGNDTVSTCGTGYTLSRDRRRCVDVDECKDGERCMSAGEECLNTDGGYECVCRDGYIREGGVCVDFSICSKCEHMLCSKSNGVNQCRCRERYRVSPLDPTKCLLHCEEESCEAQCIYEERKGNKVLNCFCPSGFIQDPRNHTNFCTDINECDTGECDQQCENSFGSYTCSCNKGFQLLGKGRCVRVRGENSTPPPTSHPNPDPVTLPSYIKTGSVLGISVFLALCAALLCVLVRNITRRCRSVELPAFRAPDIDVFYLQQVTTETYKRLSLDRQLKTDLSRL